MFGKKRPINNLQYGNSGQMAYQGPLGPGRNQQPYSRNQPNPYPIQQPSNWNVYQQPSPYYPQQPNYQPYGQNYLAGYHQQNTPYQAQSNTQNNSHFIFQNPLQQEDQMIQNQYVTPMNSYPSMNPYPKQNVFPKQPSGVQSLMNSFKSQDGSVDFNKMVNTAGQMMNAVTQVSSLVKGVGGIFKA